MNEFEEPEVLQPVAGPSPVTVAAPVEEEQPRMAARWKEASKKWAKETSISYFSNPSARRDFRVQFRGNKSSWLFASYLVILTAIGLGEYWRIDQMNSSLDVQQSMLTEFYQTILIVLGVAVSLVAPALSATAIVAEKQRRSLDLVFSAPVKPARYLIGKIIASYRYTWILLALSLPVTAMCIMLGGASWGDVLEAYFLLSVQGVVLTSIGLLFSSVTEKAISAVIYTYAAVGAYLVGTGILAEMVSQGRFDGGAPQSLFGGLNPFLNIVSPGSYTEFLGLHIPNILLSTIVSALIVRVCLLTSGTFLVPTKAADRSKLRTTAAGGLALAFGYVAAMSGITPGPFNSATYGILLFWGLMPLAVFMPFLSCFGFDGENRSLPNGLFSFRRRDTGTPSNALPTVLGTILACSVTVGAVGIAKGVSLWQFLPYVLYTMGFWSFFWSIGRAVSSYLTGLKIARMMQFLSFVGVLGLPVLILGWIGGNGENGNPAAQWVLHVLWPVLTSHGDPIWALTYGLGLTIAAGFIAWWSETNLKKKLNQRTLRRMARDAAQRG